MPALIFLCTAVVEILKVTELAPAGTVTLAGTLAFAGRLLVRETTIGLLVILLSVTVPTELDPPTTVVGFKVTDKSTAGTTGVGAVTASVADLVIPAYVAVILPAVVKLTAEVVTVKFAAEAFPGTVTILATEAAGFALARFSAAPLAGAGPDRLTVPTVD
jgi:hypothetical protein